MKQVVKSVRYYEGMGLHASLFIISPSDPTDSSIAHAVNYYIIIHHLLHLHLILLSSSVTCAYNEDIIPANQSNRIVRAFTITSL